MRLLWLAALLFAAASPRATGTIEQPKLAVLEFEVQKGLNIDRRTFSSRLQNAARKAAPNLFVMTEANIETLVRSSGKPLEECEGQCAVDTGRLIGADIVIAGRISRVGKTLTISMQMYETKSGELLAGEDIDATSGDELLRVSSEATKRLLASLASRGTTVAPAPSTGGTSMPAPVFEAASIQAGAVRAEPKSGLRFVAIPAGRFKFQGDRAISIKPFELGDTETTVDAYGRCVRAGACSISPATAESDKCNWNSGRESHPINCVDWNQALSFCTWIGLRLPTEEEWEYVASGGGEGRPYPWGDQQPDEQRAQWNRSDGTAPVASHPLGDSRWGLHDLAGNVWEWTSSDYDSATKVIRGGGWNATRPTWPEGLRTGYRARLDSGGKYVGVGFRCAASSVQAGEVRTDPKSGLAFVQMPDGRFHLGCEPQDKLCFENEKPGRQVALQTFWIGKTDVTADAYAKCSAAGVCNRELRERDTDQHTCTWKNGRRNHPINCVNWEEARTFCSWIGGQLPTVEQWEYAAKSGENRIYPWGNEPVEARRANYCDRNCPKAMPAANLELWKSKNWIDYSEDDGYASTAPVGSFPAGATRWGLLDMAGNVSNWTASSYDSKNKELRGGSWSGIPQSLRASHRDRYAPLGWSDDAGFRCVL